MKVEYTKRAVADLRRISKESNAFGEAVAAAVGLRIREVITRVSRHPESATRVLQRPGMRVVPLLRYLTRFSIASSTIG